MRAAAHLNLTGEQLAAHLQVIAHATHVQLDTATQLLGGEPDAVLEVLEIIMGTHLLTSQMTDDDIENALTVFRGNVLAFISVLRRAAAAEAHRRKSAANDNHCDA